MLRALFFNGLTSRVGASLPQFVSRAGWKLAAALDAFALDLRGRVCVDLGSHVGGFVDCLLQRGAARVYAVEPGRGVLDRRLRGDARVVVCEGANALDFAPPEPCDLATIDVGWTPLRLVLGPLGRMLRPGGEAVALVKPHYEAPPALLRRGVLPAVERPAVLDTVRRDAIDLGWTILGEIESPITGHGGNAELLWRLARSGGGAATAR